MHIRGQSYQNSPPDKQVRTFWNSLSRAKQVGFEGFSWICLSPDVMWRQILVVLLLLRKVVFGVPQLRTEDMHSKATISSSESPQLSNIFSLLPGDAQNIAFPAVPTARNSAFIVSASPFMYPKSSSR